MAKRILRVTFKVIIASSIVFMFGATLFLLNRGMYGTALIFGIMSFAHLHDHRGLFG